MSADTIAHDLAAEFATARLGWQHARNRLARRDSPLNREAVTEAAEVLDTVLDFYLELDCN